MLYHDLPTDRIESMAASFYCFRMALTSLAESASEQLKMRTACCATTHAPLPHIHARSISASLNGNLGQGIKKDIKKDIKQAIKQSNRQSNEHGNAVRPAAVAVADSFPRRLTRLPPGMAWPLRQLA